MKLCFAVCREGELIQDHRIYLKMQIALFFVGSNSSARLFVSVVLSISCIFDRSQASHIR